LVATGGGRRGDRNPWISRADNYEPCKGDSTRLAKPIVSPFQGFVIVGRWAPRVAVAAATSTRG